MTKSVATVAIFVLLASLLGSATSSTSGTNLVKTGNVVVESIPTEDEYVSSIRIYQDAEGIEISGRVYTQGRQPLEKGHVDIEVINPDGTPIKQCAHYFAVVRRKLDLTAPFYVRLRPINLPRGTKVRLTYHHTTAPEEMLSRCND
jgi:hypothetical protein